MIANGHLVLGDQLLERGAVRALELVADRAHEVLVQVDRHRPGADRERGAIVDRDARRGELAGGRLVLGRHQPVPDEAGGDQGQHHAGDGPQRDRPAAFPGFLLLDDAAGVRPFPRRGPWCWSCPSPSRRPSRENRVRGRQQQNAGQDPKPMSRRISRPYAGDWPAPRSPPALKQPQSIRSPRAQADTMPAMKITSSTRGDARAEPHRDAQQQHQAERDLQERLHRADGLGGLERHQPVRVDGAGRSRPGHPPCGPGDQEDRGQAEPRAVEIHGQAAVDRACSPVSMVTP